MHTPSASHGALLLAAGALSLVLGCERAPAPAPAPLVFAVGEIPDASEPSVRVSLHAMDAAAGRACAFTTLSSFSEDADAILILYPRDTKGVDSLVRIDAPRSGNASWFMRTSSSSAQRELVSHALRAAQSLTLVPVTL